MKKVNCSNCFAVWLNPAGKLKSVCWRKATFGSCSQVRAQEVMGLTKWLLNTESFFFFNFLVKPLLKNSLLWILKRCYSVPSSMFAMLTSHSPLGAVFMMSVWQIKCVTLHHGKERVLTTGKILQKNACKIKNSLPPFSTKINKLQKFENISVLIHIDFKAGLWW